MRKVLVILVLVAAFGLGCYWLQPTAYCLLPSALGAAASKSITVTPGTASVIKAAIAAQKGHVVVLNFWATWCAPCCAEFPSLVRLQNRYRSQGLVVMAVSADMTGDIDTKVKPFLTKLHVDFPVYLQQADDPEDFINAFDAKWQGDLPRTFIYDKGGKLVTELVSEQNDRTFAAAVEPLLH